MTVDVKDMEFLRFEGSEIVSESEISNRDGVEVELPEAFLFDGQPHQLAEMNEPTLPKSSQKILYARIANVSVNRQPVMSFAL